jgi:hypothetical protein
MPANTTTEPALSPRAGEYQRQLEALRRDALALTADLTDDQINWHPTPERWSIAQCLSHLVLSGKQYAPGMAAAVEEARRRAESGLPAYRSGFIADWVVRSMEPPPRLRVKTFRTLEPSPRVGAAAVNAEFMGTLDALADTIARVQGVDPKGGRMRSPFLGVLRLTLDQAIRLQLGHARRHLWQAWQVRKSPRFPGQ